MTVNLNTPQEYEGGNLKFDLGPHFKGDRFKVFNDIFNINVYKKIEAVVKQGTINWGYSKKINIKLHVRLLMYSIYFFTIQQQVFGADKIEKFNMNDVINTAVDNFLHGIKT